MDDLRLPTPPPLLLAPSSPLPPRGAAGPRFAAVEFPGPVTSVDQALTHLGGLARVSRTLEADPAAAALKPLQLDFDPANRWLHSIPGNVATGANIVCRVIKRRRKVPKRDEHGQVVDEGVYSIQPVGHLQHTVRFRAMADFTFTPEPTAGPDATMELADALASMDIGAIRDFNFPPPQEDFPSSAFLPPPAFSRHALPQMFDLKPAAGTVAQLLDSGATRLIATTRYKPRPIQTILFVDPAVPKGPDDKLVKELGRSEPRGVELKLRELLEKRPVWTRLALLNQLTHEESKVVKSDKSCLPMVAYTFGDGPWRDLLVRFGYDPRRHPDARFYQHINLRNAANVRTRAQPGARSAAQSNAGSSRWLGKATDDQASSTSHLAHMFDGIHAHSKIANFQLVDVSDPLLSSLIHSTKGVLGACSSDPSEGWFAHDYLEQIRQILRRKWLGALEATPVSDADCADLLALVLSSESRLNADGPVRSAPARVAEAAMRAKAEGRLTRAERATRKGSAASRAKGKGKGRSRVASGTESDASETPSGSGTDAGSGVDGGNGEGEGQDDEASRAMRDDHDDDDGDEAVGSGAASSGAESGSQARRGRGTSGSAAPSGSGAPVAKAPWELPRKKRTKAKAAESEADLLARLSQQTRRKSSRLPAQSSTPAPTQGDHA
ncbi:uncharacterized protein RHOBADRAFT_50887 [Rhodotorula graminis WP1]|uniref:Transcription factor IIIC subunit 5 HTH domain-containing protein n=1 Tax=Rhodotorula graminis (strain WP1) TaxID=578459 RepID=A0A194SCG0_RHOGW|nr:uncharacterized protein RHOBADRAFT_50887 [Rhodotorula graminis WP1]KPV78418.1 hypothetical protein RHOBADRAFT_50887 [Rhodotorula graminis WP1]